MAIFYSELLAYQRVSHYENLYYHIGKNTSISQLF